MKKIILLSILCFMHITKSSDLPHPPIEVTQQHEHINTSKDAQFIIGCDISVSDFKLGVFEVIAQKPKLILEYHAKTKEIKNFYVYLEKIIADIKNHDITNIASIGIALPGIVQSKDQNLFLHPHLPWSTSDNPQDSQDTSKNGLRKDTIRKTTGLPTVYFINDFQAAAIGIQALPESQVIPLQMGTRQQQAKQLVVGAGNGLGASLLLWDNTLKKYTPQPLNYSFTEYAAQSEQEFKYYQFLKDTTGNIAWGKVLGAGAGGIVVIYNFLNQHHRSKYKDDDQFVSHQNSEYLTIFSKRNVSLRCQDAVDFYMQQYIRFLRNAIYAQNPLAGVYVTNAIVQYHPELFNSSSGFINKLVKLDGIVTDPGSKTYLENYLKEIPIYLVTNTEVQLYGAALLCIEPTLITN